MTRVEYSTLEDEQMENLRKMFIAMSKDIRVVLIKIADRLHNTRTMQYQTPAKQISKCMETMDIYAPLAHRLGMQKIKWELEDTSLRYLQPQSYEEIMTYLNEHEAEAEAFMQSIQNTISGRLSSVNIHGTIYGRIKHVYSIFRKMQTQGKKIDEMYDLYAFRVIVDTISIWCRGGSKTIFLPPSPICIRVCIPPSSVLRVFPLRCRSAPGKCIRLPNTA